MCLSRNYAFTGPIKTFANPVFALSGNPSFNGKSRENIHWILEIPLLYLSPFPILEQIHEIYTIYS